MCVRRRQKERKELKEYRRRKIGEGGGGEEGEGEGEAGSDGQNQLESIVNYLVMTQSEEHIIIWRALSKKSDELFLDRFL